MGINHYKMTEPKFRELYTDYIHSGLSIKEYSQHMGYHKSSFYCWLKKYPKVKQTPTPSNTYHQQTLSPILIVPDSSISESSSSIIATTKTKISPLPSPTKIEITHPNGLSIKITGTIDPSILTTILNPF